MFSKTSYMHRVGLAALATGLLVGAAQGGERLPLQVPSSIDKKPQTCYLIIPEGYENGQTSAPLLVALHSWSGNVEQRRVERERLAEKRGWLYLSPDFRGVNDHPEACGSPLARQDILDAVAHVREHYRVDARRIYLTGTSGGGHMTMQMVARHPELWAAASAWVGISDLAAWQRFHAGKSKYAEMMRLCCSGVPGDNSEVDQQYRDRSPLFFLHQAKDTPLDIVAGVHDGHTGSVPVRHSLEAFNAIAKAQGKTAISEKEILQISRKKGRLDAPHPGDELFDKVFGRKIYLRRHAGRSRVSIFEGGHEGIPEAAIEWLSQHVKPAADE